MDRRIAGVVLDMDGLMLDTEAIYKASWQRAASELGFDLNDASYATLVGRDNEDCERELVRLFGAGFPMPEFRSKWAATWRRHTETAGIDKKAGLLELLTFMEGHNLPFAVATSSDRYYAEYSLGRAGLLDRFRVIVTGDQISNGKPAPDIYLEAARRLNLEPAGCVALEDSSAGTLAASRAGMLALLIPDLHAPSEEAVAAAFRVLGSLHEARHVLSTLIANDPRRR